MSVIQVSCIDQVMTLTNTPVIASGGVNENYIEFTFCSQWDGFAKVCVFYQQPGAYYYSLLDSANTCVIPAEVCAEPGPMYFGIVGVKDDVTRTSEVIKYKLVEGVMTKIEDPTEDVYQQILAELVAIREEVAGIVMPEDFVTGAQFSEHTEDKDNPHGVTAEQIGAAPADHTHTAEQIGAAPADHTHTAEQIGAAPADHTHTAEDVGAAEAEHTHTLESLGAAAASKPLSVTITAASWDSASKEATVTCDGITPESKVIVTPDPDSYVSWCECLVRAQELQAGAILFLCEDVPESNLTANVLIMG